MDISSSSSLESSTPSIIRKVEFLNVQDQYCHDEDLICEYALVGHDTQEHDRISIYKIGWTHIKEYVLFEWAPMSTKNQQIQTVTFNRPSLPKDSPETMYHFCYISADNKVLGASPPFQFCADSSQSIASLPNINSSLGSFQLLDSKAALEKDKEIARLREENALLKETLKMIVYNKNGNRVQKEVEELKGMVQLFQKALRLQENEIGILKRKLEEKENSRNVEKFKSLNIVDMGDLETLPPFPKCL